MKPVMCRRHRPAAMVLIALVLICASLRLIQRSRDFLAMGN